MAQAPKPRSKKVCVSKSKVKFYFSTVRTRVIPILKRVEVGDYPAKIGRIYGWSKQHVSYYLKKLQKAGLVKRKVRTNVVFYELTSKGKKLLVSCEGVVFGSGVYRLHRCMVRFRIASEGVLPGDFRRVEMVNWTALLGLECGVKVRHTSSSWIVHVETLYGRHPGELFVLAKNLADRVAKSLMLKYGCKLSEGEICRGYELGVDDPVAQLLSRYFTVSTGKRKMDHSPGELEGEIDHLSRDSAIEYLLMPERVKALEGKVEAMNTNLEELTSALQKLFSIERQQLEGQRSMQDYVA
ncbi:MAG: winged helix DNA-binding protein [Candidatus Bathyarchaeota archaeon]|nr:winged helix DNA-binding protein [Candidatus Bathyarchaeota archaeon]MDH5786753.1 winged helix DNA-binding protein [Candidatus Bathyarchaeota archaeon]